jgi:Fe-S oxidoreductase
VPRFADRTLRRSSATAALGGATPDVWVWADSFTDHFFTQSGHAAIRYLEAQGLTVRVISEQACCGLTWVTTGQLDQARSIMERTLATLAPYVDSGVPVIGLEPSCLATLRSDAAELVGHTPDVLTFAELVERERLPLPDLSGVEVVAQPHCHHHAVLGWKADADLLADTGATVRTLAGCCGLAGNFGVEIGHYEVSLAVADQNLLPAIDADPDAVVLADGFSCRTQITDLRHRPSVHLAQLLDGARPSTR